MKKLIKKISISSGVIFMAGIGSCALINTVVAQNRETKNMKTTNQDWSDSYHFYGDDSATDRTYLLQLSTTSNLELWNSVYQCSSNLAKGNAIFDYLTLNWAKQVGFNVEFLNDLVGHSDTDSVHKLFNETNAHTWKSGFSVYNFMIWLKNHIKDSTSMSIYVYVDYVFLGHNKYGTKIY